MTEQTRLWPDETFTIPGYRDRAEESFHLR